jgi:leucyl aminopeptidase
MKIMFASLTQPTTGAAVVFVLDGCKLTDSAQALDRSTNGALSRAMRASRFKGKVAQTLHILAPERLKLGRIMLVGLGKPKEINEKTWQRAGGYVYAGLQNSGFSSLSILVDSIEGSAVNLGNSAANLGFGAALRSYRFDKYRTQEKVDAKPSVTSLRVLSGATAAAKRTYTSLSKIVEGVTMTRNLVSEPPNVLYPESLAQQAKELSKIGVKVQVFGEAQMKKLGMGALLGVGQGSRRQSQMVVLEWNGGPKSKKNKPIAFVGKGVTFDTGGISLKPGAGMEDMKWDMGGSGVVIGLMKALAGRKARANVVGVIGLVENMPDGNAQRPGDIVTSMSGQTIEILNTDAEGRLVLADALHYTIDRFDPEFVVNLATLTGAIIIALGNEHAGMFSNNDQLCERLSQAGGEVDEKVWRMPLNEAYDKLINTPSADMQNIGGRGAGAITAAQFLQRFIGKTPWAHLDIAGVTWSKKDAPTVPKGGTAFGVRLLDRLVTNHYEK